MVNFLSKSSLESLDISDIDLGCSGCTNNGLEDALIASKTLHHFNFRSVALYLEHLLTLKQASKHNF